MDLSRGDAGDNKDGALDPLRLLPAVLRLLDGVLDGFGRQLGAARKPGDARVRGHGTRRFRRTRYELKQVLAKRTRILPLTVSG